MPLNATPGPDSTTVIPTGGEPGVVTVPSAPNMSTAEPSASAPHQWPWWYWVVGAYILSKVMR